MHYNIVNNFLNIIFVDIPINMTVSIIYINLNRYRLRHSTNY